MEISQEALAEFIELYKAEFDEDRDPDEALIMARNLVIFYKELYDKGVFQAALERGKPPPPGPASQE